MARIGDYRSAPDAAPAAWVVQGLRGFGQSVLSVVPAGFDAYARIFHPAGNGDPEVPVRWRDIARANGRTAHRMMQWPSITGPFFREDNGQPGVWDRHPEEGALPAALAPVLTSVLAGHTATPGRCWFGVWDGWGALEPGVAEAPAFELPHRRLFLLTGPITAISRSLETPPWWRSPTVWWPEDRAWCVATEIDFETTYVGGTRACIAELTGHPALEAVTVDPADGITWASDEVNPAPGNGAGPGCYIVVSGPPGSGKTTLATALAEALSRPLIAKDTIKEALMTVLPVPDVPTSRAIGTASVAALLAVAAQAPGAVLESVWHRSRSLAGLGALPGNMVEVFCRCDQAVAARRYARRAATRATGHFDAERMADSIWNDEVARPVAGGWPVIEVDTTGPVELGPLIARIRAVAGTPPAGAPH